VNQPTPEQIERWERRLKTEEWVASMKLSMQSLQDAVHNFAEHIRADAEAARRRRAENECRRQVERAADDAAYAEWKATRSQASEAGA
jgi:hypothetical protein